MLRRIHDPERGASYIEYAAVIAAVGTVGIADRTAFLINEALHQIGTTIPAEDGHSDPDHDFGPTAEQSPDSGADTEPTGTDGDTGSEAPNGGTGGESGGDGTDNGDDSPLPALPGIDTADLNPLSPTQVDPLGLDGLMPGVPDTGRLQLAYGPGDLLADSRDIADRAKNTALQRGKDAWENTRQLFTTDIGDTIAATAEGLYTDIEKSAEESVQRYGDELRHGSKLKAGAGIAFDAAFYTAFDSPVASSPALNEDRRDEYAHGHWAEALTNTGIDTALMLIPGPRSKSPGYAAAPTPPPPNPIPAPSTWPTAPRPPPAEATDAKTTTTAAARATKTRTTTTATTATETAPAPVTASCPAPRCSWPMAPPRPSRTAPPARRCGPSTRPPARRGPARSPTPSPAQARRPWSTSPSPTPTAPATSIPSGHPNRPSGSTPPTCNRAPGCAPPPAPGSRPRQ